ncbi:MAG: glycosyltransferase [Planctomycetota bacterium]
MTAVDVAVVIPCYNAEAFLEETLRSVFAQTRPAAEVVVVDDGSTDDSGALAERLGARCVRQSQGGPAAARNRGVRETTASLVAFLDADDRFAPTKLERQVERMAAAPRAVACCCDAWLLRDGSRGGRKNERRAVPTEIDFDHLLLQNPIICSTVLARRDALLAAGGFDEDPEIIATEDYDLWLRLVRAGRILYLDEPLLDYRLVATSLSDDRRFLRGIDRIMDKVRGSVPASPELEGRIGRRRARVRVDLAYQLTTEGQGAAARALLREARRLGGWSPGLMKRWLRTFVGRRSTLSDRP